MTDKLNPREQGGFGEEGVSVAPRWLAASVMFAAVAGFVGLAWYAYNAGTRSIEETELQLVEADSSPVKEKPEDPGGMKFPNQDKSIFDAMAGDTKVQQVERVLPLPEEPLPQAEAKTWINDKLAAKPPAEPVPPSVADGIKSAEAAGKAMEANARTAGSISPAAGEAAPAEEPAGVTVTVTEMTPEMMEGKDKAPPAKVELKKHEPAAAKEQEAPIAPKVEDISPAAAPAAAAEEKPAEKKAAAKPKAAAARKSGSVVQLGAYRSEAEAKKSWDKLKAKHGEISKGDPNIVKADLGEKGVFFRLRVSVLDPKEVCEKLTAKGQPCMVVGGK